MHPTVLATQRGQALERIALASRTLAKHLHLDPAVLNALTPQGKDPQVMELRRLEGVAALLEAIAAQSADLTSKPAAGSETVSMETAAQEESAAEGPTTPDVPVTTETLPAPVLEEDTIDPAEGETLESAKKTGERAGET